jgi:hypothetical protein
MSQSSADGNSIPVHVANLNKARGSVLEPSGGQAPAEPAWPEPDAQQISRFLELLGKPKGTARLRAFYPSGDPRKDGDKGRKAAGSLFEVGRWQREGRGVYAVINDGGDNDREITACRAVFCEWDDRPIEWQVGAWRELGLPEPSFMVATGGKSVHCYWVLSEPIEPAAWKPLQQLLLEHADADRSIHNPARVMRLPGCWYMHPGNQAGELAQIIHESGKRYDPQQIAACLPEPEPAPAPAPAAPAPGLADAVPLAQLLPRDLERLAEQGAPEGCRNADAFRLAAVAVAVANAAAAAGLRVDGTPEAVLLAFAARCSPPLAEHEALACLRSAEGQPRSVDPGWPERLRFHLNRCAKQDSHQQQQRAAAAPAAAPHTEPEPDAKPFRILGWCPDRSRIHYQHRETGQIASIKPAAQAGPLLQLARIGWWATFHPARNGSGIDWPGACSDVIEQANRRGVFAVDRVRGRGLWMEGSRTVWHLGDRLEVDGQEVALIEHRSAHHYPRLPALDIDRTAAPLSDAEGREILAAVAAMGWASPFDPLHLLGWAVLANVGGALDKRPVLQITSRFGSGKTFTRERVLQPLLAGLAISRSNSTEAGIRQLLRADTLPVLIDESEGEDAHRREGHLRLARLSFDGSPTDRGTTNGQALSYAIRSSVAMVGINATINNPAERSRTVLVGREQLPQAAWAGVDRRLAELLTPEAGARLLRRTVNHLPTLRANVATFRRAVEAQLGGGAGARAGDTYGALLAGAHLLTSAALVDDAQALQWLDSIGWSAAAALGESGSEGQNGTAESVQCLQHLLSHEEPWRTSEPEYGTGRISVRELIELARTPSGADDAEQARKALGRRGIKAADVGLQIANTPEPLATIYGRTKWRDGGHRARLLDLPGAYAAGAVRFAALGTVRACCVPWEVLM